MLPVVPEFPIAEKLILAYHLIFGTLIPFLIIVSCNIGIIITLRHASKQRSQMGVDKRKQKAQEKEKSHLTRMLILVCFAYVVLSIPARMYDLVMTIPQIQEVYDMSQNYWNTRYMCQYFLIFHFWEWNYGINFYLYIIGGGKKYRTDVHNLIRGIGQFCAQRK